LIDYSISPTDSKDKKVKAAFKNRYLRALK